MIFQPLEEYEPLWFSNAFEIDLTGGRGRGGSHNATEYFLYKITRPEYFRGFFMRLVHSDIRNSLYQDFKDRITEKEDNEERNYFYLFDFNDSKMEVTYRPTGNKIFSKGFRKSSSDRTAKMKSIAGATNVIIEEFDEVMEEDYLKLMDSLRTGKVKDLQIIRIWNPPLKSHWVYRDKYTLVPANIGGEDDGVYFDYVPKGVDGHLCLKYDYTINHTNLNEKTVKRWEQYRENEHTKDHYYTDIRGLVSSGAKGQIFKNWKTYTDLPGDSYFYKVFGIDWGGNDPNTFIELNFDKKQKRLFIKEHLYRPDIRNAEFIHLIKAINPENHEVVADSARKDKRLEFADFGINIVKSDKSKINDDFRKDVVDMVKEYEIFIHEDSKNLIKEAQEFKWAINHITKEPLNKPEDANNHCWDAIFYATRYYHVNNAYRYNQ